MDAHLKESLLSRKQSLDVDVETFNVKVKEMQVGKVLVFRENVIRPHLPQAMKPFL
jgi:hypothetical protein